MKTIGELQAVLSEKDPNAEFEILVQNNPDAILDGHRLPHIVILIADGDTLRLN